MKANDISIPTPVLNIAKFGFSPYSEGETGVKFYRRDVSGGYVELMVAENVYSVFWGESDQEMVIANRYEVKSQEELDFLIMNGRVGYFFSGESHPTHHA